MLRVQVRCVPTDRLVGYTASASAAQHALVGFTTVFLTLACASRALEACRSGVGRGAGPAQGSSTRPDLANLLGAALTTGDWLPSKPQITSATVKLR